MSQVPSARRISSCYVKWTEILGEQLPGTHKFETLLNNTRSLKFLARSLQCFLSLCFIIHTYTPSKWRQQFDYCFCLFQDGMGHENQARLIGTSEGWKGLKSQNWFSFIWKLFSKKFAYFWSSTYVWFMFFEGITLLLNWEIFISLKNMEKIYYIVRCHFTSKIYLRPFVI